MTKQGWEKLLTDVPMYGKANPYRIPAYSEMMPAPLIGWRPYGTNHPAPCSPDNPYAWLVSEREQAFELGPGLQLIAGQVLAALERLDREQPAQGINREKLQGNIYWPKELAGLPGAIPHERYVTFMPLALSKTQDDKGRVRWTFFGGSEQGPDRAFWKSFYHAPGRERRPEYAVDFIRRLLRGAYGEKPEQLTDLRRAGFRILPGSGETVCKLWRQDPLPSWTAPFLLGEGESLKGVKYLLTFRPFGVVAESRAKGLSGGQASSSAFSGQPDLLGCAAFSEDCSPNSRWPCRSPCSTCVTVMRRRAGCASCSRAGCTNLVPAARAGERCGTSCATPTGAPIAGNGWSAFEDDLAVVGDEVRLAHVSVQLRPGCCRALRQADGAELPDLDRAVRNAPGRAARRP